MNECDFVDLLDWVSQVGGGFDYQIKCIKYRLMLGCNLIQNSLP